jgi:hypothetical protein
MVSFPQQPVLIVVLIMWLTIVIGRNTTWMVFGDLDEFYVPVQQSCLSYESLHYNH